MGQACKWCPKLLFTFYLNPAPWPPSREARNVVQAHRKKQFCRAPSHGLPPLTDSYAFAQLRCHF